MRVIKAEQVPLQNLNVFSMADIEKHAKAIVIAAKVRAERFIHAAQQEAEELKRKAHAQALVEGKKEGLAKGIEEGRKLGREEALAEQRQQLSDLVATLTLMAQNMDASRLKLESDAQQ